MSRTGSAPKKRVRFKLAAPQAREVYLAGDFTDWQLKPLPMNRNAKGEWTKQVTLAEGEHQYKFIVDGEWWTDPANSETRCNDFGQLNCVKHVNA